MESHEAYRATQQNRASSLAKAHNCFMTVAQIDYSIRLLIKEFSLANFSPSSVILKNRLARCFHINDTKWLEKEINEEMKWY